MIDPSIALNVRPPQFADPLEQAGKAMNLLAMRQQIQAAPLHQQLLQQQADAGAMENTQRQLDMQDQQKMRTVWTASGGDPDKMFQMALRAGIGPKPLMALKESLMKQATEKATLEDKTLANHAAKNDQLNSLMQPVLTEADPQKQAALWDQQQQEGLRQGILTPEEVQAHPYPGSPDGVKQYAAGLATDKWITSQAALLRGQAAAEGSKREAELQPFKVAEVEAKKEQVAREQYAREHPQDPAAQQAALNAKERADKAQADREFVDKQRHERVEEGQGAARVAQGAAHVAQGEQANRIHAAEADPYGQLGINPNPIGGAGAATTANTHGEEFLKTLPPTLAAKVKAVTEGRAPMPGARGGVLRGEGKAVSDAVYQYEPEYSQQRGQIRTAFTTGKAADNIGSLNTATVHLDQLMDAAKALGNGSFRPGNAVFNSLRETFGSSVPTNFEMLKNVAAGEAANALKGTATDPEIAHISSVIRGANSDKQLQDAFKELMTTYGAKLNTYQERYQQQIPGDKWSPVLPTARSVFQKHGITPTASTGAPAAGGAPKTATDYLRSIGGAK